VSRLGTAAASAALLVGALACGARSRLDDGPSANRPAPHGSGGSGGIVIGPGGAGGAGGSGGSGGSGAAGGGGSGGTPDVWPCAVVVDGPVGVAGGGSYAQVQPRLSYSSSDHSQVTAAIRWQMPGGAPMPPSELRHVSFAPWGAWLSGDVAPSYLADLDRGVSFAIGNAPGNHFALLMSSGKPGGGMVFTPSMTPNSGALPPLTKVNDGTIALFLATRGGNGYLAGFWPAQAADKAKYVQLVTNTGTSVIPGVPQPITCTGTFPAQGSGAVGTAGGWLLAMGGSGAFGSAMCPSGTMFDSTIHLATVDSEGKPKSAGTLSTGKPFGFVALTAVPGQKPWLAWSHTPADVDGVLRLDESGVPNGGLVEVPNPGYIRFAAVTWQGGLLLLRGNAASSHATFVAPNGAVSTTRPLASLGANGIAEALASPDGKSVLIALTAAPAAQLDRIRLARLRCQ
jgi:hypothetical protein